MTKTCTYCPKNGVAYIDGKLFCAECGITHAPKKGPRPEIAIPERKPEEKHVLTPRMPRNMFVGRRKPPPSKRKKQTKGRR